jgi:hypothetical protein
MKQVLLVLLVLLASRSNGQVAGIFDGRWCFTGSRNCLFQEKDGRLFYGMIDEHDSTAFSKFYKGEKIDDMTVMQPVTVDSAYGKYFLSVQYTRERRSTLFVFVFDRTDDSTLHFVGDVYYPTTKIAFSNSNCNLSVPACSGYFYKKGDILKIAALKNLETITRQQAFAFFDHFRLLMKIKCNRCYEGFPGGDMNRILVNMGFNPVTRKERDGKMLYETSAFDFIMDKFVGNRSEPKDKELQDYYRKIHKEFWDNKD